MSPDVTAILSRLSTGDAAAMEQLIALVYDELRRRASRVMSRQPNGQTLQATALLHEALLKMGDSGSKCWSSTDHFYNAVAEVMRQILVDRARARNARKRGGGMRRVSLTDLHLALEDQIDWPALDDALSALHQRDQRRYQVVMLRFFAGLSDGEIAAQLKVSEKTVQRDWKVARMFLAAEMRAPNPSPDSMGVSLKGVSK